MNTHQFGCTMLNAGYQNKTVIQNLSVDIPANKVTVILGANGCGKSTLLKTMARLIDPQSGGFCLDGKAIREYPTRKLATRLGLLPQTPLIPEGVTVEDLVARGRYPHHGIFSKMTKRDYEIVDRSMVEMGIQDLAKRRVDELSGGQRQRVWIAVALAQDTDILLLDEPTTYLDITHQIGILDSLRKMNREKGITTVMILHDINLSIRYADYILAMKNGKLAAQGTPEEIINSELIREVYQLECTVIRDPETGLPFIIPKVMGMVS